MEEYNEQEGLALSPEEIAYLHKIEQQNGRPLTDSEIFGFALDEALLAENFRRCFEDSGDLFRICHNIFHRLKS